MGMMRFGAGTKNVVETPTVLRIVLGTLKEELEGVPSERAVVATMALVVPVAMWPWLVACSAFSWLRIQLSCWGWGPSCPAAPLPCTAPKVKAGSMLGRSWLEPVHQIVLPGQPGPPLPSSISWAPRSFMGACRWKGSEKCNPGSLPWPLHPSLDTTYA